LELDFFSEELNLAIEVQGKQHYQWVLFFQPTKWDFYAQKRRDNLKRGLCAKKGITLIEAPYWIKTEVDKVKFLRDSIPKRLKFLEKQIELSLASLEAVERVGTENSVEGIGIELEKLRI